MGRIQAICILALALWVGGVTLFWLVVAPALRRSGREEAGRVVSMLLPAVDRWSQVWGGVTAAALFGLFLHRHFHPRSLALELPVAIMATLTFYASHLLHPEIQDLRQRMTQPEFQGTVHLEKIRFSFNRLHRLSVRVKGLILFLGWLTLALIPSFLR